MKNIYDNKLVKLINVVGFLLVIIGHVIFYNGAEWGQRFSLGTLCIVLFFNVACMFFLNKEVRKNKWVIFLMGFLVFFSITTLVIFILGFYT